MKSVVLGEGSYGCIHKPSLHCSESKPPSFYENHVSKLMLSDSAKSELAEYVAIQAADPAAEYYPGTPTLCLPDYQTAHSYDSIRDCGIGRDVIDNQDQYSLLIMPDAGVDLKKYGLELEKRKSTPANCREFELFWIEVLRLIVGLSVFLRNDLVHHDLKPHNIVYNESTHRLKFIDFGLMRRASDLISNSQYKTRKRWFNFPPEIILWNKSEFYAHIKATKKSKQEELMQKMDELIVQVPKKTHDALHIGTFITYVAPKDPGFLHKYLLGYYNCTDSFKPVKGGAVTTAAAAYTKFMEKSVSTFDVYGLGMALTYVLNHGEHLMTPANESYKNDLRALLSKMTSGNVAERPSVHECITEYENILNASSLLVKHNKHIDDKHQIVDGIEPIQRAIANIKIKDILVTEKQADTVAAMSPPPCPSDKDYNPKTKKCVPKCKSGTVRNPTTFRCNKEKPKRETKKKSCKEGKELNDAGRCVKKCPEGKTRNPITKRCV